MNCKKTSQDILKMIPERAREVVSRRFALGKNKKQETLESIGKSFKITRERVRQIESDGIKKAQKALEVPEIKESYDEIISSFEKEINNGGGIKREDDIINKNNLKEEKNHVLFLLSLSKKILKEKESDAFNCFWATDKEKIATVKKIISSFKKILKEKGSTETIDNLYSLYEGKESKEVFCNYLEISKDILKTLDKEKMGLSSWPEVNPRTVKDKIKIILKKEEKPIHFKDIADMVKGLPQKRNLHPQTVHNELIRNQEFVLVGRGYYALKDWGYNPGQVKDVIYQVLSVSENGLHKEDVVNSVLNQRMVKESTILLNLQNKKFFKRDEEGKYKIKEA